MKKLASIALSGFFVLSSCTSEVSYERGVIQREEFRPGSEVLSSLKPNVYVTVVETSSGKRVYSRNFGDEAEEFNNKYAVGDTVDVEKIIGLPYKIIEKNENNNQ